MGVLEKVACDVIERPKMPRATWDALRAHVVRERKKKKEENQEVIFDTSSFDFRSKLCDLTNLEWRYWIVGKISGPLVYGLN